MNLSAQAAMAAAASPLAAGEHCVQLVEPVTADAPPLLVLRPDAVPAGTPMPLAVCVHGVTRQPLDQLRAFAPWARELGFALVLPLFDERRHRCYQQLVHPRRGTRSDLALLTALDAAAEPYALDVRRLYLFGYSGGAQFVHRFALRHPRRTAALAVGAAGWYTWPDAQQAWPLGIGNTTIGLGGPIDLAAFVRLPMALWVGERDTAADEQLRKTPGLFALQGANRLQRAQRWADAVRSAARFNGAHNPLVVSTLPRAGHDFVVCDRRGGLARQVMGFFNSVRHAGAATHSRPRSMAP